MKTLPQAIHHCHQDEHYQTKLHGLIDGFDSLWEVTDSIAAQLPEVSQVEQHIADQREQIFALTDEITLLREENAQLKHDMAQTYQKFEAYEKLCQDYVSVVELNRTLTKRLNTVMAQRDKELAQIRAMRAVLG